MIKKIRINKINSYDKFLSCLLGLCFIVDGIVRFITLGYYTTNLGWLLLNIMVEKEFKKYTND
jgi:hypothetical protein